MTGNELQSLRFQYDALGNLKDRWDDNQSLHESFGFDGLNRLTASTVAGRPTVNMVYDDIGNITFKTGVGSYTYGQNGAGPHAVTTAGAYTYQYDANGSLISRGDGQGQTLAGAMDLL